MKRTSFAIITVLFLCLGLAGCVPLIIGAAAGGLIVYDKRHITTILADSNLKQKILIKAAASPSLKGTRVEAASFNQNVLLVGEVRNSSQRNLVEHIARNTPGVKRLYNQIAMMPNLNAKQRARDSFITSNVKSQMLLKPDLSSGEFKVVTENRVVYLMGTVSHSQANLAVNVARRVNGVRRVVILFDYRD